MHASTVVALAFIAVAAPALAIPTTTPATASTSGQSGAISTSEIKDFVNIGNDVITGAQNIKNLFTGNNQRREFEELLTRAFEEELMARDAPAAQSGAVSFGAIKDIGSIAKGVFDGVQGISNLFSSNDNQQQKREFEELLTRAIEEELMARDAPATQSGAISFGAIKDIGSIAKGVFDGVQGISNLFSSNNQQQRREFEELLTRAIEEELMARDAPTTDASGALNTGLIHDIVDIGNDVITGAQGIKNLFTSNNQKRSDIFEELMARSPASTLQPVSFIPRPNGFPNFRIGTVVQSREEELLARARGTGSPGSQGGRPRPAFKGFRGARVRPASQRVSGGRARPTGGRLHSAPHGAQAGSRVPQAGSRVAQGPSRAARSLSDLD